MNAAYLLIGGNLENRQDHLQQAAKAIEQQCGHVQQQSFIYETEAWGLKEQDPFLNQALKITTPLSANHLLSTVLQIEKQMGRIRRQKFGPRIIDIDILLFNNAIIQQPDLVVPHPELANRRFALQCLRDIAAEIVHPVYQKTIQQLLLACTDPLQVKKFNADAD